MKKTRFTETQIIGILKEQDSGIKIADICRKHGISDATFHNWKKRYGGLSVEELKRMKELEHENSRLKRLVADLSLDNQILKEINGKKW
jgi:putative transposase